MADYLKQLSGGKISTPKATLKGVAKAGIDFMSLGTGLGDKLLGDKKKPGEPGYEAEQEALIAEKRKAYADFIAGGGEQYKQGQDLNYQDLDPEMLAKAGNSGLDNVSVDPQYHNAELDALRSLEEQSQTGLTARDQADMAKLQGDVGRTNSGRIGAIQQNMAARGLGGSGLEMVSQMQAAQAAADREATAALEQGAVAGERRNQATNQRAALAGQMGQTDYNRQAQAAQANDAIKRFNVTNSNNTMVNNNHGQNQVAQQNNQRANTTADNQTQANYAYSKDKLGATNAGVQTQFDYNADKSNKAALAKQQAQQAKSGQYGAVMGAGGAVVGGIYGGPAGAAAGGKVGQAGGELIANYAHGGTIQGPEVVPGDDPANDVVPTMLSGGEKVLPKSVASNPQAAAQFVAQENAKQGMDPMILDHLAKSNPDLVAQYRQKLQGAEKGQADAKSQQDMGSYANVAGGILNDYNNSQKKDVVLNHRMQDLGTDPTILKADRPKYDGSAIDKMGAQGVSAADAKLEAIKKQMAQDYSMQRDGEKTAEDTRRYDQDFGFKQAGQEQADRHFNAEMGQKQSASQQSADQFGQTMGLNRDKFGEEVRSHQAEEGLKGKDISAKGAVAKLPSVEQQKFNANTGMGLKAVRDMREALKTNNTFSAFGDNDFTESQRRAAEAFGRLQSGGAINKDEEARFIEMGPKATDDAAMQERKLANQEAEYMARMKNAGIDPETEMKNRNSGSSTQQPTTKPSWAK